jgi:hypothetical protein
MAKKPVQATETIEAPSGTSQYRIIIGSEDVYRGDIRDAFGNIIKTYLIYDMEMLDSKETKKSMREQEKVGNVVSARPGDLLDLPKPTRNPYNETAVLLRAGVIKAV